MINVIGDIISERRRQLEKEDFSPAHDDEHSNRELAAAAACYANPISIVLDGAGFEMGEPNPGTLPIGWPEDWDASWWKPSGHRRNLVKAAALIIAEIERLDRKTKATISAEIQRMGRVPEGDHGPGEHQEVLDAIEAHNSGEEE